MKALVITDRQEIADYVIPRLEEKGFDIIRYKWIIKALDNIEEIQPDVVVLSADEYPRQWKTLAGFVQSGIGGKDVEIYLYENVPLNNEDKEKASSLGVCLFDQNLCSEEVENSIQVELVFNNPDSQSFVFCQGDLFEKSGYVKVMENIDYSDIKYLSVFDGKNVKSYSAKVEKADSCCKLYMSECL